MITKCWFDRKKLELYKLKNIKLKKEKNTKSVDVKIQKQKSH